MIEAFIYRFFGNESVSSTFPYEYFAECKELHKYSVKFVPVSSENDYNGVLTVGIFKDNCGDVYLFQQAEGARNKPMNSNLFTITLNFYTNVWKAMAERLQASLTRYCFEIAGNTTAGNVHYIGEKINGGIVFSLDSTKKHGLIVSPKDLNGEYGAENWDEADKLAKSYVDKENKTGWRLPELKELGLLCRMKDLVGGLPGITYWSSTRAKSGDGKATVSPLSCGDAGDGTPINTAGLSVRAVKEF